MPTFIQSFALLSAIVCLGLWSHKRRLRSPLPPGPRGYPIIGNIFDMPSSYEWLTFTEWGKVYGDVLSLRAFRSTIIIINSYHKAVEMFDNKGAIYSDRPPIVMVGELMDMKRTTTLDNGPSWKVGRALLRKEIGSNDSLKRYEAAQQEQVYKFLRRLTESPKDFKEHISEYTGAVILGAVYGYKVEGGDDHLVALHRKLLDIATYAASPGTFLVNYFPILKYIPSWVPGAEFQRIAANGRRLTHRLLDDPYDFVKRQMEQGNAPDSFTARQISEGILEDLVKWTAMTFFTAGAETTIASIYSFFHAMVLNPDVQKKALIEIDQVLGPNMLPSFSDRENLPYVNALLKEVLRFYSVTPLGLPHYSMDTDIQDGYLIPKNSIVIANLWGMCHDPEMYKDPMIFNPSRFLGNNPERDPRDIVFGFGRRICAGELLAQASLYIVFASTLAMFELTPALDDAGKPDPPKYEYTSALSSHPVPFRCTIKLRPSKDLSWVMNE